MNLDELERLYKAATPGKKHAGTASCYASVQDAKDAAFSAALHNAFPALLALARDGERWRQLCHLWAASTELCLRQDEEGTWSITQVEDVEGEMFDVLRGETPDAAIDAARKGEKP